MIEFIHLSKEERRAKSVSLITVIVHSSNVLSPAIFRARPLKGTLIGAMFDAGRAAALTKNLDLASMSLTDWSTTPSGKARTTSKRLGLAIPPDSLDLNLSIVLSAVFGGFCELIAISFYLVEFIIRRSNSTNNFFKADTRAGGNEGQTDEVNRSVRFDVNVSNEFIVINDRSSVVCLIANNDEVCNTSLRLNIAEERFYDVDEVQSCDFVVEFKQLISSGSSDCFLKIDEQTANIDSVECRCFAESSLVTEEDNTSARREDDWVNSCRIQSVSLSLRGVVCKFNSVQDSASCCSTRREPGEVVDIVSSTNASDISVEGDIAEVSAEAIVHVLITTIKDGIRRRCDRSVE